MNNDTSLPLPHTERRILHIDMNAFFASVEQQANPYLRGKPIAVAHKTDFGGSAILAASYPAKRLGIGLGTRLWEALQLCPELIAVPLDTDKYYSVNRQIVQIFREEAPVVEVYSIDEAFLDVTDLTETLADAEKLAYKIKHRILSEIGECLTTSMGVSHNKLLAKIGSNFKKPDAITVVPWETRFDFIDKFEIGKIWGIGFHSAPKLRALGINSTADLRRIDSHTLSGLVGSYYTRLQMIANGEHYEPVSADRSTKAQKSMQHAHTLSTATNNRHELETLIRKHAERLTRRLRRHHQKAKSVNLGLRPSKQIHYGWGYTPQLRGAIELPYPTNHGKTIYHAAMKIFDRIYTNEELIRLVVVGVDGLNFDHQVTLDLDGMEESAAAEIDSITDEVNNAFGEFTIRTGDILYQYAKEKRFSVERENMTFHPD